MRKILLVACCAVLLALTLGPVTAALAVDDVFQGTWTAIDSDGSNLTLTIQGSGTGGRHAVRELDDSASVCGGAPASVQGWGTVDGDTMDVLWTLACQPGGNPFRGPVTEIFTYDPGSDTLTDSLGIVFHRAT